MPNLFSLIGEAWQFQRRQPAIAHVTFWFLFLPMLATGLLTVQQERSIEVLKTKPELHLLSLLGFIIVSLIALWGTVCILSIGKRLLQAKAGRTRTSFKAVRAQSKPFFMPLLLTNILASIFTLLWALLLIIPGIIYAVRTVFFTVIVVCEGTFYRDALKRSQEVVRGKFWPVFGTILGLSVLTILPANLLMYGFRMIAEDGPLPIVLAAEVASSIITSFVTVLYLLAIILAYGFFRPKKGPTFN